jgi:hypothetical protein
MRHLLLTILLFIPAYLIAADNTSQAPQFIGVSVDSLIRTISTASGTAHIGGIWTATTDGATVGIIPAKDWQKVTGNAIPQDQRTFAEQWAIILLNSPDPFIQPGEIMGWLTPAAKPNNYNAIIYTKRKANHLTSPHNFTLQLHDDGHLTMRTIKKGLEINPWRMLPYLLRRSLKYTDETPRDLDGFTRQWPLPRHPQSPRSL